MRALLPAMIALAVTFMPAAAQPARTVEVDLSEWAISMPASLPAGRTTLVVTNTGGRTHNIAIEREGTGRAQRFGRTIAPGARAAMTLDLVPGTYRVSCPVFGHATLGMVRTITVAP